MRLPLEREASWSKSAETETGDLKDNLYFDNSNLLRLHLLALHRASPLSKEPGHIFGLVYTFVPSQMFSRN